MGGTVSKISAEEGFFALWKGVNAAWLREASYTSLRLGLYEPVKVAFGATEDPTFFKKFAAGSAAGALGSLAGNPFDVLKTKMMTAAGKEVSSLQMGCPFIVIHRVYQSISNLVVLFSTFTFLPMYYHRSLPSPPLPKSS